MSASAIDTSRLVSSLGSTQAPEPSAPPASAADLTPTPQQAAFLSALTDSSRNICLQARAGCGKTSAILMGVSAYLSRFPNHEILVCAYNKSIQLEVAEKLKQRGFDWRQVQCQTVHSMGMALLKYVYRPEVDEKKVWKLLDERAENEPRHSPWNFFGSAIVQLVGLAKQTGVGFFPDQPIGDRAVWYAIAEHYDLDIDSIDMDEVVTCAQDLYSWSLDITSTIDFNDMVLHPLIKNLPVRFTKHLVMGDEAQDWSPIRQALVRKHVRSGSGRLVIVGDDRQAVYGWTGADAQAMHNLTRDMDATTLPLSVTWRCPKQVVSLAQKLVPDLEAAPTAPEGEVLSQAELRPREELEDAGFAVDPATDSTVYLEDLTPGRDVILCRNTAPLISLAYKIIRAGIPARVEGRKIGEGLAALVQRWTCKTTNALRTKLEDYRERETQKHIAKGNEAKADEASDRVDTLLEIIAEVERRGYHDVASVLQFIDKLFGDEVRGCVVLCTYHRSKGREWRRVLLFEHGSRCPSRAARQAWQKVQESNLAYVAMTRAMETLVFIG